MPRLGRAVPVLGAIIGLGLLALGATRGLETVVERRIAAEAARRGLVARAEEIRVGLWPFLRLGRLAVERPDRLRARFDEVSVNAWPRGRRGWGGVARVALGPGALDLPAGLGVELHPSEWELTSGQLELVSPGQGLVLRRADRPRGRRFEIVATRLAAGRLLRLGFEGAAAPDLGLLDGDASGETDGDVFRLKWRFAGLGTDTRGTAEVRGAGEAARLEARLEVERIAFAELLAALGLELPFGASDLGTLSGVIEGSGPLAQPATCAVRPRLRFRPPDAMPAPLVALRSDFTHEVKGPDGGTRAIVVSPASPDFLSRADVPPLFLETLLLGEDAAFFSHPGLDLTELPRALATNWARAAAARGGSTITQQLAKNLFLTREKSLARKLRELVLAFLLEAALGKDRILEIYLNLIEWGPGIHGLRPAARHYFDKEPRELTAKESAFLVALIPGPLKYQRSFAEGALSPGFEPLVLNLLEKLRASGALSEEAYAEAVAEPLAFRTPVAEAPPAEG